MASEIYMARQPIYDRSLDVAAYELLFRSGKRNEAGIVGSTESAQAVISSLIDIGLCELSGENRAFINVDQDLLMCSALTLLPQNRIVLEILETVRPTAEAVKAVKDLRDSGYIIALDDFELSPLTQPFLPYASIVKFDVRASAGNLVKNSRPFAARKIDLLAEKIESEEEFKKCVKLGFKYFQGYYFSKPEIVKGARIPSNKVAALRVAASLQNPEITMEQLESAIGADLALTHRLLKLVSSAHFGLATRVNSIRQTVMFLGVRTVASVATLIAMAASSNKPAELSNVAFIRAKMCELLAAAQGRSGKERYFTTGLLSVIDAMMDLPMSEILAELSLDNDIHEALLDPEAEGEIADVLRVVLAYEAADFNRIEELSTAQSRVAECYRAAIGWANEMSSSLGPTAKAA
ncbi:MAG TPA: HDOD domain-containing protein [Fimbriimonadaceae bacterium]|jgi:EAL and modified HD-GYP domain-containing signal transduction protein